MHSPGPASCSWPGGRTERRRFTTGLTWTDGPRLCAGFPTRVTVYLGSAGWKDSRCRSFCGLSSVGRELPAGPLLEIGYEFWDLLWWFVAGGEVPNLRAVPAVAASDESEVK